MIIKVYDLSAIRRDGAYRPCRARLVYFGGRPSGPTLLPFTNVRAITQSQPAKSSTQRGSIPVRRSMAQQ